jgi:hypothetical protein
MSRRKIVGLVVAGVLLAGTAVAVAAPRGFRGLDEIGQKAYWSLLSEGQREQAKELALDYVAATAPDRLAAASRWFRLQADVATVLTQDQRREAAKLRWIGKNLPADKRREVFSSILDGTDREALAKRVERLEAASPEERVTIGIEILDQVYDAAEPRFAEKLGLTADQRARIRTLVGEARTDLVPVAVRLSQAKSGAVTKGLDLLDAQQRQRLDTVRTDVRTRVLAFLRGK